eukprot:gb/GECG01003229.1/.p1 GENE.gb/GECG01003229.1/~~gb/GECG01003229.1/.p1  ORF type:complete len:467 (+),score=64.11 gb/GECG01003229.1/:1-1401(+)
MPVKTLEGGWHIYSDDGGAYTNGYLHLRKHASADGEGKYTSPDHSQSGSFHGKFMHGSTAFKGKCEQSNHQVAIKLEKGDELSVTYSTDTSVVATWKAERASGRRSPTTKLSTTGVYKDKTIFERLTTRKQPDPQERKKVFEESLEKQPNPEHVFSDADTKTLAIGDPYDDTRQRRQMKMSRYEGKQMTNSWHVHEQQQYEHMAEPYLSKIDIARKLKKEKAKSTRPKDDAERPPFRPNSSHMAAGRDRPNADMYLLVGEEVAKDTSRPHSENASRRKSKNEEDSRIPIKVTPVKKGSFGYPGTLLGERPESPTRSVHEYMHSDYEGERKQMKAHMQSQKDPDDSRGPFLSLVSRGNHPDLKNLESAVYLSATEDRPNTVSANSRPSSRQTGTSKPEDPEGPFYSRISQNRSPLRQPVPYVSDPLMETPWTLRSNKAPIDRPAFRPSSASRNNFSESVAFKRTNIE